MVKKYKDTSPAGRNEEIKYRTDQSMDIIDHILEMYIPSDVG